MWKNVVKQRKANRQNGGFERPANEALDSWLLIIKSGTDWVVASEDVESEWVLIVRKQSDATPDAQRDEDWYGTAGQSTNNAGASAAAETAQQSTEQDADGAQQSQAGTGADPGAAGDDMTVGSQYSEWMARTSSKYEPPSPLMQAASAAHDSDPEDDVAGLERPVGAHVLPPNAFHQETGADAPPAPQSSPPAKDGDDGDNDDDGEEDSDDDDDDEEEEEEEEGSGDDDDDEEDDDESDDDGEGEDREADSGRPEPVQQPRPKPQAQTQQPQPQQSQPQPLPLAHEQSGSRVVPSTAPTPTPMPWDEDDQSATAATASTSPASATSPAVAKTTKQKKTNDPATVLDEAHSQRDTGNYEGALTLMERALDLVEKRKGRRDTAVLPIVMDMASLHRDIGELTEAVSCYTRALDLAQSLHDSDVHPDLLVCHEALSTLHSDMNDPAAALPHLLRTIAMVDQMQEQAPTDSIRTVAIAQAQRHSRAASLLADNERWQQAVGHQDRALQLMIKAKGDNSDELDEVVSGMGRLHDRSGNPVQALQWYDRALHLTRRRYGERHINVADLLSEVSSVHKATNAPDNALAAIRAAIDITEEHQQLPSPAGSPARPEAARSKTVRGSTVLSDRLQLLGELLKSQGKGREALEVMERCTAMSVHLLGNDHVTVAARLSITAQLYYQSGNMVAAEKAFRRVLRTLEGHSDASQKTNTISTRAWLAEVLMTQEKYDEALVLLKRLVQDREMYDGRDSQATASALNQLAQLHQHMGQPKQALPLLQRTLVITESTLGRNHPDVAIPLNNIAELLRGVGRPLEALPYYERALALLEYRYKDGHPHVAILLNNMAEMHRELGNFRESLHYYLRAIAVGDRTLGPNHPTQATYYHNISLLYSDMGNTLEAARYRDMAVQIRGHSQPPQSTRGGGQGGPLARANSQQAMKDMTQRLGRLAAPQLDNMRKKAEQAAKQIKEGNLLETFQQRGLEVTQNLGLGQRPQN